MFLNLAVSLILIPVGKYRMFIPALTEIEIKMKTIQISINKPLVKQMLPLYK